MASRKTKKEDIIQEMVDVSAEFGGSIQAEGYNLKKEETMTRIEEIMSIFNKFNSLKNSDGTPKELAAFNVEWVVIPVLENKLEYIPNIRVHFKN